MAAAVPNGRLPVAEPHPPDCSDASRAGEDSRGEPLAVTPTAAPGVGVAVGGSGVGVAVGGVGVGVAVGGVGVGVAVGGSRRVAVMVGGGPTLISHVALSVAPKSSVNTTWSRW